VSPADPTLVSRQRPRPPRSQDRRRPRASQQLTVGRCWQPHRRNTAANGSSKVLRSAAAVSLLQLAN